MLRKLLTHVEGIYKCREEMCEIVQRLCRISSTSTDLHGLMAVAQVISEEFKILAGKQELIELPPRATIDEHGNIILKQSAPALTISQREDAKIKLLLVGHMDTVLPYKENLTRLDLDKGYLYCSGAADMKGGLVVMLKALELLEKFPHNQSIGWQVIIIPDEEIGSVASQNLLRQAAKNSDVGLIFEPALPDGSYIHSRKGSINIAVIAHGHPAHVGRDFTAGRNAIVAVSKLIMDIDKLAQTLPEITVNIAQISGGEALNIVPKDAVLRINVRYSDKETYRQWFDGLEELLQRHRGDVTFEIVKLSERLPKPQTPETKKLFEALNCCWEALSLEKKSSYASGGVCDGNTLAAAGLPTIDTLGVIGGGLHTPEEWMEIKSLPQRAAVCGLLMMALATGDISLDLKPGFKRKPNVTSR